MNQEIDKCYSCATRPFVSIRTDKDFDHRGPTSTGRIYCSCEDNPDVSMSIKLGKDDDSFELVRRTLVSSWNTLMRESETLVPMIEGSDADGILPEIDTRRKGTITLAPNDGEVDE